MSKRGRPIETKPEEQSTKFTREYISSDKVKHVWTYDLNKFKRGPISVDIHYPSNYVSLEEEEEKLPISKRKYLNPNTGKWVSYARAYVLGLIEKKNK
jgi:hypothetical protein